MRRVLVRWASGISATAMVASGLVGVSVIEAPSAEAALLCPWGSQSGSTCYEYYTYPSTSTTLPPGASSVGYTVKLVGGGGGGGGGYDAGGSSDDYGERGSAGSLETFTSFSSTLTFSIGQGGGAGTNAPNGGTACNLLSGLGSPSSGTRGGDTTSEGRTALGGSGGTKGGFTSITQIAENGPLTATGGKGGNGGFGCTGYTPGTTAPTAGSNGIVQVVIQMATVRADTPSVTANSNGTLTVTASAPAAFPVISSYEASCTSSDGGAAASGSSNSSPITVTGVTRGKNYTCTVRAYNGDYGSPSSASSSVQVPGAPQNTTPPSFTGTPAFKSPAEVLTGSKGVWDEFGLAGASYSYLWQSQQGNAAGVCSGTWSDAAGATKTTLNYTIVEDDVGKCLRLTVTGSNSDNPSWGSNTASSSASLQVTTQPAFTAQSPPEIADVGYYAGYTFVASGYRMTYSIDGSAGTGLPAGMSINGGTGALIGDPDPGTEGVHTYRVIATNASSTVTSSLQTLTVSSGVVDRLIITRQPVGGPSRQVLATQPIIQIRDSSNRLIANPQSVVVTSTGSVGGSQAAGLNSSGGAATFTNLTLGGLVNTPYTLTFTTGSGGGVRSVTSDSTEVTPGTATTLVISRQPVAAAAAGAELATQPIIRILDADTNLVTSSTAVVTLTPESGGFVGPTASSVVTATASGGIATFSGVAFGGPVGVGKTLTFSSPSLTSVVSGPVTSTAVGQPYKLAVTTPASSPSASGSAFATSPVITRQDMAENTVATAPQAIVSVSVSPSGTYQSLVGQTSWTTASGVATFVGLGISGTSGSNYTLTFSSPGLVSATQTVVPSVGAAAGISLTATGARQPSGARYGADLTQQPIVRIIDSGNNPVSVNGVVVTASVASGDGTIANNTATTNSSGIAIWTNMRLSGVAGPFTLTFSADGYGTVTSAQFQLQKALQTLTFGSLTNKTIGDPSFGISATSSADLVITYTTSTPAVCGVSSSGTATGTTPKATAGLVSILGGGTCTITASQAGDNYYDSATASQSFTVNPANQATLSVVAPSTATAGQTIQLYSAGGSGSGAVTFAESTDPGGICSVTSAGVVTFSGTGNSCSFTATKAADASYNSATSAAATITIAASSGTPSGLSAQSVAFTSTSPETARVGDTYTATAITTSGLAPTMSIASGSGTVCSISSATSPATVTFSGAGTCQLQASRAANARFAAASPDAFQTIEVIGASAPVGLLNQSITYTQPSNIMLGSADIALTAAASSGLAVTFTSSTTSICTVTSSGVVHPVAFGTCVIVVAQSGSATYEPADSVTISFLVTAGVPSAPFITSVSAGNGSVIVSLLPPGYNGGSAIVGYRLVATPSSGSSVATNACSTTSPCVLTGLANGTSYSITLAAINAVGIGAYGSGGSATPTDSPGSPLSPSASRSGTSVTLTWSQPVLAAGVTFVRYDIFQRVSGTSSWGAAIDSVAPITVTTYTITGLDENENYDFRILSVTVPMADPEDAAASVVQSSKITTPGAPESLTANRVSDIEIFVTWAAPASNGGSTITGYTVAFSPSGSCSAVSMDGTTFSASCSASSLAEGTRYTISVRATNAVGTGSAATTIYTTSGGGGGGGGGNSGDDTDGGNGGNGGDTDSGGSSGGAGGDGAGGPRKPFPPEVPTPEGPSDEEIGEVLKKPSTVSTSGLPTLPIVKGSGPMPGGNPTGGSETRSQIPGVKVWPTASAELAAAMAAGAKVSMANGLAQVGYLTSRKVTIAPEAMLQLVTTLEPDDQDIAFRLWMQDRSGKWFRMGRISSVNGQLVLPVMQFGDPGTYQVVATSVNGPKAVDSQGMPVWGTTTVRYIVIVTPRTEMGSSLCPNMITFDSRSAVLSKLAKRQLRKLAECLGAMPAITVSGYVNQAIRPEAAERMAYLRARNVKNYLQELGYDGGSKIRRSITAQPASCAPAENRCAVVRLELGNPRAAERAALEVLQPDSSDPISPDSSSEVQASELHLHGSPPSEDLSLTSTGTSSAPDDPIVT